MNRLEALKQKIQQGRLVKGVFVTMADPAVSEMVGWAGYDYVWIDAEHAPLDRREILAHVVAAQGAGACAFVRVPGVDPRQMKAILDLGPDGVIFPFIDTAELAEQAVRSCAYPPRGIRGQGPIRAIRYGLEDEGEYLGDAYSRVLKILQIESVQGYENLDTIMQVPGVDSIFIGGADLTRSIADSSPAGKARFEAMFEDICRQVRAQGLLLGCATGARAEDIRKPVSLGVQWVVFGQDARIMSTGLRNNLLDVCKEFA